MKTDVGAEIRRSQGRRGAEMVDNQSTESSFHSHQFKADGVLCLVEGGEEAKGDSDFIWQLQTPSHSLCQKKRKKIAQSTRRALPQKSIQRARRRSWRCCGGVKNSWGWGVTDGMNVDDLLVGLGCLEAVAF